MPVAFVFNCDFNGLALIQSLGRKGVDVYALDCKRSVGTYSRYSKFKRVTSPVECEDKFIMQLNKLASKHQDNVILFPTNDIWVAAIAKNQQNLAKNIISCCPNFKQIKLLLDKYNFGKWADKKGFDVPKVFTINELKKQPEKLHFPIAIKAVGRSNLQNDQSYNENDYSKFRFLICKNKRDLLVTMQDAHASRIEVFGQELVVGQSNDMYTIGFFSNKGKVSGVIFGKKIRGFPADFGDCVVGEARPVPSWAQNLAERIGAELSYSGIAEIELMKDRNSGQYKIIEINPRSWSWIGVGIAAGVDLPWIAFNSLTNKSVIIQKACKDGIPVRYSKILQDIQNTFFWYQYLDDPSWGMSFKSIMQEYYRSKNTYAEFHKDDPMILIFSLLSNFKYFLKKFKLCFKKKR